MPWIEQIGGCQRWELGVSEMGEEMQKVQSSSCKTHMLWVCDVSHGDCS